MVRGKKVINGKTYSLITAGVMKTGWAKESSKWYYYDTSGAMQTNCWIEDSYYVGANGVMAVNTLDRRQIRGRQWRIYSGPRNRSATLR